MEITFNLILVPLVVSLITQLIKKFGIKEKFGDVGIYAVILAVAFLIKGSEVMLGYLPEAAQMSIEQVFTGTIALYEILLKRLEPFKKLGC